MARILPFQGSEEGSKPSGGTYIVVPCQVVANPHPPHRSLAGGLFIGPAPRATFVKSIYESVTKFTGKSQEIDEKII